MLLSTNYRKKFVASGFVLFLATFFAFGSLFAQSGSTNGTETVPGQLIIKLLSTEEFQQLNKSSEPGRQSMYSSAQTLEAVQSVMSGYDLADLTQVMSPESYEDLRIDRLQRIAPGQLPTEVSDDLVRTYFLSYNSDIDPFYLASKIQSIPGIEYAEPQVLMELHYEPNDPLFGTNGQDYFDPRF